MTNTVKWTSTVSSRLLVQGGWSSNIERYNNLYQPGIEQPAYSALWYPMASAGTRQTAPRGRRATRSTAATRIATTGRASASYVTGTHNITLGFQDSFGTVQPALLRERRHERVVHDAATACRTPPIGDDSTRRPPVFDDRLNSALGIYAQDNWTMKRLTLNYGLRWDYLRRACAGSRSRTARSRSSRRSATS